MRETLRTSTAHAAGSPRLLAGAAIAAAAVLLLGCGGGRGARGTGRGGSLENAKTHPFASERGVQSRGIKGESPSAEAATRQHISAADCSRLAQLVADEHHRTASHRATPRPPLSTCRIQARTVSVEVFLDTGFAAHQRYENRITETVQFGETDPARDPHPVAKVGETSIDDSAANWIPALNSLLAVRGDRWLTVTISAAGRSEREEREEAAALARLGFRLTAR